jgi:hypothetical protein
MKIVQRVKLVLTWFLASSILLMVLPISVYVSAVDTTPPQFYNPSFEESVYCGPLADSYIWAHVAVYDNVAIADVRLVISGPNGYSYNESLGHAEICEGNVAPLPSYGTYAAHLLIIDTSRNQVVSPTYYLIIMENTLPYVHVDTNAVLPYDGSALHPFPTIDYGLNAVSPNGTIFLHNGIYNEAVGIDKSIIFTGEQKENVIIQKGIVINGVNASYTTLSNLTVQNPNDVNWNYGIQIDFAQHNTITNCIIDHFGGAGITLGTTDNLITHCDIQNNYIGILFITSYCRQNIILHNNFFNNTQHIISEAGPGTNTWDDGTTGNFFDDYLTHYPNATVNHSTWTWNTPYILDTNNIDHHAWVHPNGDRNDAPATPSQPIGSTTGEINGVYLYTTQSTDPNNDQMWYQWKFGSISTPWRGPYTSGTVVTERYIWPSTGVIDVTVKAKDTYGDESPWSTPLHVTITNQTRPHLIFTMPTSVSEGNEFDVTLTTSNGNNVENAQVSFNGETKPASSAGMVTFTAPQVESNTAYQISAQLTGYESATTTIVVMNHQTDVQGGWIYGIARDESGALLSSVKISVRLSQLADKITFTDNYGQYNVFVPVGTYSLEASKQGYITNTVDDVNVILNTAVQHDFTLQTEQQNPTPLDKNQEFIEYTIQEKATQGAIAGRINCNSNEKSITYYSDGINLALNSNETNISFVVSAADGTSGTILVVSIGDGVLSDLDSLIVTYDGQVIPETTDVAGFFTLHDNTTSHWLRFLTTTGLYLFIQVPHFSTHTIMISSLPTPAELLSGITAIIVYVLIAVVVALVFIGTGEITKRF